MEEKRCVECGEILLENAKECPKCGCPVEDMQSISKKDTVNPKSEKEKVHSVKKADIMQGISLIVGILIIVLGCILLNHKVDLETYSARAYKVDSAAFGGDFYTEIYSASDTIVDELSDINGGIEAVSGLLVAVIEAIYYGCGMIVIALGFGVIAISLVNIGKSKK